jgi:hypothetical protein
MSAFQWSIAQAQWLFSSGSPVPPQRIKAACEAVIAQAQADMGVLAQKVISGEISKAVFEQELRRAIDRTILGNAALAHGGIGNLTPLILERCAERIAPQYEYAAKFAREINAGMLSTAQISARSVSYANEGRVTYENEYTETKKSVGFRLASRILGANDHCPGCVEAAARGFVPVEELLPIGDAECGARCRCIVVYKLDESAPTAPAVTRAIEGAQTKQAQYEQIKAEKMKTDES